MAIILDGDIGVTAADVAATTRSINAGYGSNAAAYGCRAWVNFNGTGTVAIRDSANVSSITDNSTGNYTVNFATDMPDANYSVTSISGQFSTAGSHIMITAIIAGSCGVYTANNVDSSTDMVYVGIAIFR